MIQQVSVENMSPDVGIVEGGNLEGQYQLRQFHFHWGEDDFQGSENTLNGFR